MRGASPEPVDLVEHQDLRQVGCADLGQHAVHLVDVLVAARIADVHHVQQQRRLARLGQRRLEGRHQLVRQLADESDRVGHHHLVLPGSTMRRTVGSSVANSWSAT